jgi:hypothetical protein
MYASPAACSSKAQVQQPIPLSALLLTPLPLLLVLTLSQLRMTPLLLLLDTLPVLFVVSNKLSTPSCA